ncbi:MAG: hypothetical protein ACOCWJ_05710, partial [Verrucomicrobiota bacterium]
MKDFEIIVNEWLGSSSSGTAESATLAPLRLEVGNGEQHKVVTEVYDLLARTVREHVYVSGYALARWLLLHWWRLRFEPKRNSLDWQLAHALAAIGEGYAWPPLTICGDGEFIELRQEAEEDADVAGVRYLTDLQMEVSLDAFDSSVDAFVDQIQERLAACRGRDQDLLDLQAELREEREDPRLARECRLQAQAGYDPGDVPEGWQEELETLGTETGEHALGEIAAALPNIGGGLQGAREELDAIRNSPLEIDLSSLPRPAPTCVKELPWQKGVRLAQQVRRKLGIAPGPLSNEILAELTGTKLPTDTKTKRYPLSGAFRENGNRAKLNIGSPIPENQRFHLARVMAGSLLLPEDEPY